MPLLKHNHPNPIANPNAGGTGNINDPNYVGGTGQPGFNDSRYPPMNTGGNNASAGATGTHRHGNMLNPSSNAQGAPQNDPNYNGNVNPSGVNNASAGTTGNHHGNMLNPSSNASGAPQNDPNYNGNVNPSGVNNATAGTTGTHQHGNMLNTSSNVPGTGQSTNGTGMAGSHLPHHGNAATTGAAGGGATGATHGLGAGGANPTTSTGHSPSTQAFIGKVEQVAGTILSSQTLKAKGLAKEEEANAVKMQQRELGNAEALDGNASLARDRANAHAARGNVHGNARNVIGNNAPGNTAPLNAGANVGQRAL